MRRKNKILYEEKLVEIFISDARKIWARQAGRKVRIYPCDDGETILLSVHGGAEGYKYKSSGCPISDPYDLKYTVNKYQELGYKIIIDCCHPTDVGNYFPELKNLILGYGWYNGTVYRKCYENSIDIVIYREE